jgi:hypothetical protein
MERYPGTGKIVKEQRLRQLGRRQAEESSLAGFADDSSG